MFRLKDWGILDSVIGVVLSHDLSEDGSVVPADKSELPIQLPDKIDLNAQGNPLDSHPDWNTPP